MISFKHKFTLASAATALAVLAPLGAANATNGQLPTCVGTYKCGMGGAGLSIASDPTAAAINPALAAKMNNSAILSAGWFHADVERNISGTAGQANCRI